MIIIDGHQSEMAIRDFGNLEQIIVKVMGNNTMEDRVITDVFVNNEVFSEIYPHQAEDIETGDIERVEIVTVAVREMALMVAQELSKVVTIMDKGAHEVAKLFRLADDSEALELYQDLLDVVRDFLGMIGVLRGEFHLEGNSEFNASVDEMSSLFSEMIEVIENEDWILLADLLEYEFIPSVERWKKITTELREQASLAVAG